MNAPILITGSHYGTFLWFTDDKLAYFPSQNAGVYVKHYNKLSRILWVFYKVDATAAN